MGAEKLVRKTDQLDSTLLLLDRLTTEAGQLLEVLGTSLHQLTVLTAPVHSRATALTHAQQNIASTKQAVDELVQHLDTSRRVQFTLEAGPAKNLGAFLDGLQQLERSNTYLQDHGSLAAVRNASQHSQHVFDRALQQCEADFITTLNDGYKTCKPSLEWLNEHAADTITADTRAELTLDLVPPALLPKLHRMTEVMLDAKYAEALEGYVNSRDKAIEQILAGLGDQLVPLAVLQGLPSDGLDKVIVSWIKQLRVFVILMLSEQRLAGAVWPAPYSERVFTKIVARHLQLLAQAGRDMTEARRVPEKVHSCCC
eukprot:jgi/Chrzof1/11448/Cz05g37010.t1